MNHMEKSILDIIEKRYQKKYVGGIKVTKLGKGLAGYKLVLDLGNSDKPLLTISADLEAEDFLKFVEQELISRQLIRVQWFKGIKIYPEHEERGTCCKNKQSHQ